MGFFSAGAVSTAESYAGAGAAADGKSRVYWPTGLSCRLAQPRIYCDEKDIKTGLFLYRGYSGGMLYRFPLHLFCFKVIKQGAHFIC
jgi:hypothetical protein